MDVLLALPAGDRAAPWPHRPFDGRRRARAQPLRAHLARPRSGGQTSAARRSATPRRWCSGAPTTTAATRPGCAGRTARRHRPRLTGRALTSMGVTHEKDPKSGDTLSLQTLLISSLAAVAAAIVVPLFWQRGSLIATAFTPIIVAVVSAALNRPAKVITGAVPQVTRRTATGAAVRREQPTGVGARGGGPEQLPPRRDDPFGLYERRARRAARMPWRLAIITGLMAAVIGAGVVTASELAVFGHQIGNTHALHRPARRQDAQGQGDADPDAHADRDRDRDGDAHGDRDADRRPLPVTATPTGHRHARHPGDRQRRPHPRPPPARPRHRRRRPDGEGPDPDLAHLPHRAGLEPRRRPGRAAARHPRDQPRALGGGQERGARAPPPRGRRADRLRAGDDEGRGDEARPDDELPRRRARARGAPRGVPAQARRAARRRAEGALRRHAQGDRVRARGAAGRDLRRVRPRADRRRLDRPGLPRAAARRARGGGQGPVPGRRRRGAGGHAEPRDHPAADEADRARAGRQDDRRGDPLADRRGARLRARGGQPALAGADLQGPPVHPRPRRRREPLAREGAGHRVRARPRASTPSRRPTRPRATASARSSSASTSAACTATASSRATRTRATSCCRTTGAWRSWTSGCSRSCRGT